MDVLTKAMFTKLTLQILFKNWHNLLCLTKEQNLTPHRKSELSISKIMRNPKNLYLLKTLHIIFGGDFRQQSAEFILSYYIIIHHISNTNTRTWGGRGLIIGTLDHI